MPSHRPGDRVLYSRHNRYAPPDAPSETGHAPRNRLAGRDFHTGHPFLPTLLIVGEPGGLNVAREALIELELGWEVIFAASAAEAHAIPAVRNVDVILVDLGNPYLEGVELVGSLHPSCRTRRSSSCRPRTR